MFRDILVHVDGSEAGARRLRFAVDLATQMGAHLNGLHVTPPAEVPPVFKPSRVPEVAAEAAEALAIDARTASKLFRTEAMGRVPHAEWFEAEGDLVDSIAVHARYHDIVMVGQYEWQGSDETHPLPVAHGLVLKCGRPVLVVPGDRPTATMARVAVAWDGSREAVRAVHDALPLLRVAVSVHIVTFVDKPELADKVDASRLSSHLANHGVAAVAETVPIASLDEQQALARQIDDGRYDLLVMGGYSRPMWSEFIFGGTTQSVLLSSKIPVIVSH